jgi:hypothetical protein
VAGAGVSALRTANYWLAGGLPLPLLSEVLNVDAVAALVAAARPIVLWLAIRPRSVPAPVSQSAGAGCRVLPPHTHEVSC